MYPTDWSVPETEVEEENGLNAVSLHWSRMRCPTKVSGGGWMIWEDHPLEATVERLRSSGSQSVVLPTCANTPHEGDYLAAMQRGITALKRIGDVRTVP